MGFFTRCYVTFLSDIPPWRLSLTAILTTFLSFAPRSMAFTTLSIPADLFYRLYNASYIHLYGEPASADYLALVWGLTLSIGNIAGLPGCLLGYACAKRMGRKLSLMLIPNILFLLAVGLRLMFKFLNVFHCFIVGQVFYGLAVAMQETLLPIYLIELSPVRYRGFVGTLPGYIAVFAVIWVQLSASSVLGNISYWPWLVALPAFPATVQILLIPWLWESPQYVYIAKQNPEKAEKILRQYLKSDHMVNDTLAEIHQHSTMDTSTVSLRRTLTTPHTLLAVALCTVTFISIEFTGLAAFAKYSALTLQSLGFHGQRMQEIAIAYFWLCAPTTIMAPYVIEKFGRRPLLLHSMQVSLAACATIVIFSFVLQYYPQFTWAAWICVCMHIVVRIACSLGPLPIAYSIGAEVTSQRLRAAVNGIGIGLGSIGFLVLESVYPYVLLSTGPWTVLILYITPMIFALPFLHFYMPETKNRGISDIVQDLNAKIRHTRYYLSKFCGCASFRPYSTSNSEIEHPDKAALIDDNFTGNYGSTDI